MKTVKESINADNGFSVGDVNKIVCEKKISLLNQKYVVYLKKVASRVSSGGKPLKVVVRAFVKRIR